MNDKEFPRCLVSIRKLKPVIEFTEHFEASILVRNSLNIHEYPIDPKYREELLKKLKDDVILYIFNEVHSLAGQAYRDYKDILVLNLPSIMGCPLDVTLKSNLLKLMKYGL